MLDNSRNEEMNNCVDDGNFYGFDEISLLNILDFSDFGGGEEKMESENRKKRREFNYNNKI
jgi:hypothetical protein